MCALQAIFFDFDGVLLDTEPVHWACWAEVLAPAGLTLTWEYYRDHCIGIDDRDMLRTMARQTDPPRDWDTLWALYPAKKQLFQARMTTPPFERSLAGMLPGLHRQFKLAVVSSSSSSEIEPLLVAGGIRQHFDTVVGGGDVNRHKPAADPYLLAASRLGVETALVLEDSVAGIASGRAAGFEVLAVRHPAEVAGLLRERLSVERPFRPQRRRPGRRSSKHAGRVEDGREHWRNSAAPFPIPAHQTGRAHFRHPAFRLASS